jgi:hypothetical protein
MKRSDYPYAAQWPLFTAFCALMTVLALAVAASGNSAIIASGSQAAATAGMFISGFCYRERLRQLGKEPNLRVFRQMLDK